MGRACLVLLLSLSCGRDQVGLLGGGNDDDRDGGSSRSDAPSGGDGPVIVDDFGVDPNDGGDECTRPRDCRMKYGPPPACPDSPSVWECVFGRCEPTCETGPDCNSDCDCDFGEACLNNVCQIANRNNLCCTNPNCNPGDVCIWPDGEQGTCNQWVDAGTDDGGLMRDGGRIDSGPIDSGPVDAGVATPVGDPCASQNACGPIGFCIEENQGFPGGYCSQGCGPNGDPCPSGADCRGFGGGNAICLDECSGNPDCRTEYICVQVGLDPQRVCWPMPQGSTNPNGNPVGGECSDNQDCQSDLQCLDIDWPGGYCTKQFCDPQTNPCPTGSDCFNFPGFLSLCLDECPNGGTTSDCRAGYYCLGPTGQPGGCVPN